MAQTYIKTYGEKGVDEQATYVTSLANNELIISGYKSSASNKINGLLLNTLSDGSIKWFKEYSDSLGSLSYLNCVKVIGNAFLAVGSTKKNNIESVWAIKVKQSDGSIIWSKTYEITSNSRGLKLEVINNDHAIITGVLFNGPYYSRGIIIDINPNDTELGKKLADSTIQIGNTASNGVNTYLGDLKFDSNSNEYFISGFSSRGNTAGINDPIILRLSQNSKLTASNSKLNKFNRYSGDDENQGSYSLDFDKSFIYTSGNYWFTSSNLGLYFKRINRNDSLSIDNWKIYKDNSSNPHNVRSNSFKAIKSNSQIKGLISPISDESLNNKKAGIVLVDYSLDLIWSHFYDSPGDDYTTDATSLNGNGFVTVGYTTNFDNISKDILIIRTDEKGNVKDQEISSCFKKSSDVLIETKNSFTYNESEFNKGYGFETKIKELLSFDVNSNVYPCEVPCSCPPAQEFKLEIYDGRPKVGGMILTSVQNGKSYLGQCFKKYFFNPIFNCPEGCASSGEVKIVTPAKDTISTNFYQFNTKGNWEVIVYPKCGDKTCTITKYTISIPNCDCPPPDCCKEKLEFGDNGLMKIIAKADGTNLSFSGTLFGSNSDGYKEVRISILDVVIQSENKNSACISCLTNPQQWASMGKSYLEKFILTNEIGSVNNPREVKFVSSSAVKLDGINYGFSVLLPPPSTLECCKLNATITIKITLRDNQCRECDYIYTRTIPLANLTFGGESTGTSSQGSGTGTSRRTPDLFSGCKDCLPVKNLQGSRIIKD